MCPNVQGHQREWFQKWRRNGFEEVESVDDVKKACDQNFIQGIYFRLGHYLIMDFLLRPQKFGTPQPLR